MLQILISACLIGRKLQVGRLEQPQSGCAQFYEKNGRKGKVPSGLPGTGGRTSDPAGASEIHMPDEAVMNTEGEDVTAEFLLGADFALREAKKYDCTNRDFKKKEARHAAQTASMTEPFPINSAREWERLRPCLPGMD